jgi:hypothetical protein
MSAAKQTCTGLPSPQCAVTFAHREMANPARALLFYCLAFFNLSCNQK